MRIKIGSFAALSVRAKLGSLLLLFVFVALGNFISVNYYRNISKIDTAVVDAAGRQRMLSQKIAFLSSTILRGKEEAREELKNTIDLYNASLIALKEGGVAPGIAKNMPLPATPEVVLPSFLAAEDLWEEYKIQAEAIQRKPLYVTLTEKGKQEELEQVPSQILSMQVLNPELGVAMNLLEQRAPELLAKSDILVKEYVRLSEEKQQNLNVLLWVLLIINVSFVALSLWVTENYITKPIGMIRLGAQSLVQGHLTGNISSKHSDEIGLAIGDLSKLSNNLQRAAGFAESIGKGNLDNDFRAVSQQDVLGEALLEMRSKLQQVEQDTARRKWVTGGLADFSEILRQQHEDIHQLALQVTSSLVKYLNANQGTLFMVEEDGNESYLELFSMYAWDKRKHLQKQVRPGEGLLGQAWLEKEIIYMTDVPEGYVEITSGLGKANPRSILIVPLKVNDEVLE